MALKNNCSPQETYADGNYTAFKTYGTVNTPIHVLNIRYLNRNFGTVLGDFPGQY